MTMNTNVRKAVLHILDTNINLPVLSEKELEIDTDSSEFLSRHIEKIFNDSNLKSGEFSGQDNPVRFICEAIGKNQDNFIEGSIELANHLFSIMVKHIDISPADIILCLFYCDNHSYLGLLKMNYKTSFTHYVQQGSSGTANTIIKHKTLLPSESQKVEECAIISLQDYSIRLMEKEYEINGEKDNYLSKLFLQCETNLSSKEKVKILDKSLQKINKKYFDEDFENVSKLKKVVAERLEDNDFIEVEAVAGEVFENNYELQKEYISEIRNAGLTDKTIPVPENLAEKKYRTQKIKTDTGIEINFPSNYFNNKEKLEFVNNPDGSISIIIKNVGKIINR